MPAALPARAVRVPAEIRRLGRAEAAWSVLLAALLPLACHGRPCSESDVYPGWPLSKHHRAYGAPRPHPELMGCSLVDMANAGLTQDETYELTRVIRDAASGEFRNISVLHEIATNFG